MSKQMILRHSGPSPFCRKVDIVAKHHGLDGLITAQDVDMNDEGETLRLQNPLGKIPALILDNGQNIYDSQVIVEFFDDIGAGAAVMPTGEGRIEKLTQYALANGMTEASLLVVYEGRMRPDDKYYQGFVDYQLSKIGRGLERLASDLPSLERLDIANITTAVMLEYMDLRINDDFKNGTELGGNKGIWRDSHVGLADWLSEFEKLCPYFGETRPY
ncbi:MAG: glutathione S-transferase family protein [OCS116 cluster bacterium]|uniref:Glutathione S-transferase n=1 Tax=OCS116 cluster bacterium TaxID=2030921 RepID=A0A2A4YYX1_9PROT|nr:glutathione S-transferase family protein [OCS116 cluster bacterium]